MIRLVVCRHGQSEADLEPRRIEGNADFPLTERGQRQGDLLARAIAARYRLDALYASPLQRARATAEKIAAATGLAVQIDARLAEHSNGLLAGLTLAEAERLYPVKHPTTIVHRPPEGESYLDHFRRVADFFFGLYYNSRLDGLTLCLVAHGGTINCLLDAALALPALSHVDFACGDTSIHELQMQPGGKVRVVRLNDTAHLAELP